MTLPHRFDRKILSWIRCGRCGLIRLNNRVSETAARKSCPYKDEE